MGKYGDSINREKLCLPYLKILFKTLLKLKKMRLSSSPYQSRNSFQGMGHVGRTLECSERLIAKV